MSAGCARAYCLGLAVELYDAVEFICHIKCRLVNVEAAVVMYAMKTTMRSANVGSLLVSVEPVNAAWILAF